MPSLSEVYEGQQRSVTLRRLTFGLALFGVGSLLVVAGILVATTGILYGSDVAALTAKRQLGAVLAGVGVPAVFLGIFAVLPSGRLTKAAAVVGAGIAVMGVALFTYAYPCRWSGSVCGAGKPNLTLLTVGLYSFGVLLTFWCLFVGVANFKTRNDPGGTARVNVTRKSETKYVPVERSNSSAGSGGIGFFGTTPDGSVETQTAGNPGPTADGGTDTDSITSPLDGSGTASPDSTESGSTSAATQATQTAGGTATQSTGSERTGRRDGSQSGADASAGSKPSAPGDRYCGNCAQFEYVRADAGIQPYCGAHDELMDDMDPCEQWEPRSDSHR